MPYYEHGKPLSFRGDWSATAGYSAGDVVSNDGASYVCIKNHTNQEPPNVTYWTAFAAQGATGADGAQGPAGPSEFDTTPADDSFDGIKVTLTAGENLAFGDIGYMKSDGKVWKADASAIATSNALFIATATIAADASGVFGLHGIVRDDSAYNFTIGGKIYLSETAGGITQTAPTTTDSVTQIIGVALTADMWLFQPNLVQVEHT